MKLDNVTQLANGLIAAREAWEEETRQDLMQRIEKLCSQWRHHSASGFDADQGDRSEKIEGFEKALALLSECHEVFEDMAAGS